MIRAARVERGKKSKCPRRCWEKITHLSSPWSRRAPKTGRASSCGSWGCVSCKQTEWISSGIYLKSCKRQRVVRKSIRIFQDLLTNSEPTSRERDRFRICRRGKTVRRTEDESKHHHSAYKSREITTIAIEISGWELIKAISLIQSRMLNWGPRYLNGWRLTHVAKLQAPRPGALYKTHISVGGTSGTLCSGIKHADRYLIYLNTH